MRFNARPLMLFALAALGATAMAADPDPARIDAIWSAARDRMLTQQDPLMRNWHLGSGESAFLSWTNNQARYPVNPGT